MSDSSSPLRFSGRGYLLFLGATTVALVALAGVGAVVASLRGDDTLPAILAAISVTGLASMVSGVVIAFTGGPPSGLFVRNVLATLVRLLLVGGLAAVCVLALEVPRRPFLIALVVAYLALLVIDTMFSVRAPKTRPDSL